MKTKTAPLVLLLLLLLAGTTTVWIVTGSGSDRSGDDGGAAPASNDGKGRRERTSPIRLGRPERTRAGTSDPDGPGGGVTRGGTLPNAAGGGTADTTSPPREPGKDGTPLDADPRPMAPRVAGRVLDVVTGEPVARARVYLTSIDDGRTTGAWGTTADAEGKFTVGPERQSSRRVDRTEIRVRARGYHDGFAPSEEGAVVRLEPRNAPLVRGRVVGVVRDAQDRPVTGTVRIDGLDDIGDWFGQFTTAAADGSFVLEGVRPGAWRFMIEPLAPEGGWVDALVPEGGDARVQLVARGAPSTDAGREVRVTGLPKEGAAWLRLYLTPWQYWRAAVRDGVATFPAVPPGPWTAMLQRGDAEEEGGQPIEVPEGEGIFDVIWSPKGFDRR